MNYGLISDEELIDIYKQEDAAESAALEELINLLDCWLDELTIEDGVAELISLLVVALLFWLFEQATTNKEASSNKGNLFFIVPPIRAQQPVP